MSAKMQGKQPAGGRKRSKTHSDVAASKHIAFAPSPQHKRDLPSLQAHQETIYLDAMWGEQMRQLCTEYDNQVHMARVPDAYRALLAPPNPPVAELKKTQHVRFKSMPTLHDGASTAPPNLKQRAQSLWQTFVGNADDYGVLPK